MIGARPGMRRGCAGAAAGFAALTAWVGHTQGAPVRFLVTDTSLGLLFIGAGLLAWERRPDVRTGPLLTASGALWFVGSYAPTSLSPWSELGFAFERFYDVVLGLLVLTFPDAGLRRSGRAVLGLMAAAFVVRAASRIGIECGCTGRPNPMAVLDDPRLFDRIQFWTGVAIVAAGLGVAILGVRRWRQAPMAAQRVLRSVVVAGVIAGLVASYDALEIVMFAGFHRELLPFGDPWHEVVAWTIIGLVALVPCAYLLGTWWLRGGQRSIARLAVELDAGAEPERLQAALRHALGDPTLELYLADAEGAWRSAAGTLTGPPVEDDARVVTTLEGRTGPLAAVVHDRALREDPGLVAAATAVLRLAVENERLSSVVRGQLEEVRASRARLVHTAEEERRRIERDLHDGAQQRLIAVALALQQARDEARGAAPRASFVPRLDEVADELLAAVDELRELARGIHPAILSEEGLRPAVASLARRCSVPVSVDVRLAERPPLAVETAAYYFVAEALTNVVRHARAGAASVEVSRTNGHLVVEVTDDGDGGADVSRGTGLEGLADRLDALAGRLQVESPPGGGTRLWAVIPCA